MCKNSETLDSNRAQLPQPAWTDCPESLSDSELLKKIDGLLDNLDPNDPDTAQVDAIDAYLAVLQNRSPVEAGLSAAETWKTLQAENPELFDEPSHHRLKGFRIILAAAAVICCLMITVGAFGSQYIHRIIEWGKDNFILQMNPSGALEPLPQQTDNAFSELADAMKEDGRTTDLLPRWMPADFSINGVDRTELESGLVQFIAVYLAERGTISLTVSYFPYSDVLTTYEMDENSLQEYWYHDIRFFIHTNKTVYSAVWSDENILYELYGAVTEEELMQMIHSIAE